MRCQLSAIVRAAQHPNIWRCRRLRVCKNTVTRMTRGQGLSFDPCLKFQHLLRKVFTGIPIGIQQLCSLAVTAWRSAHTQIDSSGRQCIEHSELFGHFQGCVVRQHDARTANADGARLGGNGRHEHFRCRAHNAGVRMMLTHPETGIA